MKIAFQALAITLLFLGIGLLAGDYLDIHQQIRQIKSQQQANSAFEQKEDAQKPSEASHWPNDKCGNDSSECGKEPPETYVVFGKSLKITDSFIALFTLVIACFTIALFWDGREKGRQELRAYVFIESATAGNLSPGGRPTPVFSIRNFGKTPAHKIIILLGYGLGPSFNNFPDITSLSAEQMGTLGPGGPIQYHNTANLILTTEQARMLHSGRYFLFVYGEIRYMDFLNTKRTTRFRLMAIKNIATGVLEQLAACEGGNDAT